MIALIQTLARYRALVRSLVSRELKARYRGSILGFLWSFANPLLLLLTYTLVFKIILPMKATPRMEPYFLFFFCGILPWSWFSASLAESSSVLIAGGNLIKKVLFPAEVLPTVTVLTNLVQFFLGLPILFAFLGYGGRLEPAVLLLLPLPIFVQLVFTLGCALFLSALTVHFRDIGNILGHLLQLWFFATPILYDVELLSGTLRQLERLNPMGHLIISYQQILFHGHFDHWRGLGGAFVAGIVALAVGCFIFERLRDTLAEEV